MGYFNNGIGAARINDSSPSDYTTYSGNKIETKQNATDNTLTTTSKNIVGAINEINSKVNNKFIIAQTLPVSDIDEFAIYLIPKSTAQTDNIYDEYIYISTDTPAHWEKIGDTEIDLSGYYTSSQVDSLLNNKQDATDNSLTTVDKHINGAINEHHAVIGYSYDAYDDTATYAVGDLCIYNNALYKCTTAITTAEAWNASHWTATSIADELSDRPTFDSSHPAIRTQEITVFDNVSISPNTEYNSSSAVAIPQIQGYTVVSVTEPRAQGYYGSRMVAYLWLTSATALNYSVYNPTSNITATVKVTCRVIYVRNDLEGA